MLLALVLVYIASFGLALLAARRKGRAAFFLLYPVAALAVPIAVTAGLAALVPADRAGMAGLVDLARPIAIVLALIAFPLHYWRARLTS